MSDNMISMNYQHQMRAATRELAATTDRLAKMLDRMDAVLVRLEGDGETADDGAAPVKRGPGRPRNAA